MKIRTPKITVEITKERATYIARSESVVGRGETPARALRDYRANARGADELFPGFFEAEKSL